MKERLNKFPSNPAPSDWEKVLFGLSPMPVLVIDASTLQIYRVNRAAETLFGWVTAQLEGSGLSKLLHEGSDVLFQTRLLSSAQREDGPLDRLTCILHTKAGRLFPAEIQWTTISHDGGSFRVLFISDLSRCVQAEQASRDFEEKYKNIFENAVEGIYQSTADGRFISVNPAFAKMLGYESPTDLVRNLTNIESQLYVDRSVRPTFRKLLREQGVAYNLEYEAYRKDRSRLWVSVNVREVRDPNGVLKYYEGTAEDITARKRTEAELRLLNASLKSQAEDLARSNTELQQFAYAASHDLQEPLRMVASYLTLLSFHYAPALDEAAKEYIGFAVDGAKRMKLLIDDLLDYSRITTSPKKWGRVDCNEIVRTAIHNLSLAFEESKADVQFKSLPVVRGVDIHLVQLFQNLLSNAIKFRGSAPPQIEITAALKNGQWRFCVADNGIGFEMEFRDKIFRIFQRLHVREEYDGTGVGLAICKKIVESHGGQIWVESSPGQGSRFFFSLPAEGLLPVSQ